MKALADTGSPAWNALTKKRHPINYTGQVTGGTGSGYAAAAVAYAMLRGYLSRQASRGCAISQSVGQSKNGLLKGGA